MSEVWPTSPEFIPEDNEKHDFEAEVQLFAFMAQPFQEPGWPYHNWEEHVMETYAAAMRYCDECEAHGTVVDRLAVAFIVLGHDLGYGLYKNNEEVKKDTGFDSKEALSAHITEKLLLTMGKEQGFIEKVKVGIMGTKLGEDCPTVEAKIARLADVSNTYGPFPWFFLKFLKIAREGNAQNGPAGSITNTIEQSCKIVEAFVTTADLRLGPWHDIQKIISDVRNNTKQLREQGEEFIKEELFKQKVS
jgi:hypothetical protein